MILLPPYQGKSVGVFGLGKTGEAAVAALEASGAEVFVADDKFAVGSLQSAEESANCQLQTANYTSWPWESLECVVLSPGVPLSHPVVKLAQHHGVPVIGDIELLCVAQPQAKKIAITGTNGKSTTTSLIAHILKSAGVHVEVGGNLGTPVLSLERADCYVLETSSYQLELLQEARFDIAVFLNLTPDHLDRHGDMERYFAAKLHIFDRQRAQDVAVIAAEDDYARRAIKMLKSKMVEVTSQPVVCGVDLREVATLTGAHNWQNANAAAAACRAYGLSEAQIAAGLRSFQGLPHRLELVATIHGVRFINDSKATNAEATAKALAPYENIYWILGGRPKEGGIESLKGFFSKITHAFLIGEAAQDFARTLGSVAHTQCGTLEVAVRKAAEMAWAEGKKDAVVLLSPACASFDQFKNFEERGGEFRDFVMCELRIVANHKSGTTNHGDGHAA